MTTGRRREEGVVLVIVLVFLLLLITSVATFEHRVLLDYTIARNREDTARAEALARGGVRLGTALLLEDRLRDEEDQRNLETRFDVWARAESLELPISDDSELRIRIDDAGARLNLNALFDEGVPLDPAVEVLLVEILDKAIADAELPPEESTWDPRELAGNLIDYLDADTVGVRGEFEDTYYQEQDPPYRAANRPLLSLDELALVKGFDTRLVEILAPYLSVYPYVDGEGINPNTAPPWVLGALYHGVAGDYRFAGVDAVEQLMAARDTGRVLCSEEDDHPVCTAAVEDLLPGEVFPPLGTSSQVFVIRSEARVGDVRRTVEAVIDRSDAQDPLVLSWRVR